MPFSYKYIIAALLGACCLPLTARADDTELFTSASTQTSVRPNVLIVLDSSSNWNATFGDNIAGCGNTKFCNERQALLSVIDNIPGNVNVGLMLFSETGTNGAYVRFGVRQMDDTVGAPNKSKLKLILNQLVPNGSGTDNSGSNQPYAKAMFEAFKYFGGYTSPANAANNTAGSPTDANHFGPIAFAGGRSNNSGSKKRDCPSNADNPAAGGLAGNAFNTCSGTGEDTYISPIDSANGACQKNYVLFISNGNPGTGGDSGNPNSTTLVGNVGGNATTINPPNHASLADEFARFLANTDVSSLPGQQAVSTYTIAVWNPQSYDAEGDPVPSNSDGQMINLMKSMARQGGDNGFFQATNTQQLEDAFSTIFSRIQSVNNSFAAVTLPVSTSVRGTNLNQVYLGVFRPQQNNKPRWSGNLKEYQLAYDNATDSIFLSDTSGTRHVESPSGFVVDDAVSFWTASSNFWSFLQDGKPSDSPDGAVVEKGGVAQRLRTWYPNPDTSGQVRKIYTCNGSCASGSSLSATPFNTANINTNLAANQTAFGAASAAELGGIIDWVRGKDNIEDENANFSWTDVRASVHGDIIHSRPAVINYNRYSTTTVTDNEDVVAFYGSNDGLFRAVKGGTDASGGYEKWAFIPQELFGKLKRLRDNSPLNTLPPADTKPKDYFMDGPIGIYQKDANNDGKLVANDGDKVELFIGMRRGGRFIYALDVSNPDDPKLLWKKGCFGSPATCDAGYAELGQTWSEPKLATILDTDGVSKKTVLIFGAGYDAAVEDQDPIPTSGAGATNTVGRGIFVVDAANGNVIWQAGPSPIGATYNKTVSSMTYSIPSDIALLDRNSNGFIDRAYVGDTGGNVWRVDLGDGDPGQWQVNKLASVGYAASATAGNRRKFLYPPDVVASSDPNGAFDAVLTGTGDREHPLQGLGDTNHPTGNAVANSYYMFKDRSTGSTFTGNGSGPSGTIVAADLFDVTNNATGAQSVPASNKGWVLNLAAAEKVVASSTTLAGATYFNTHQPTFPGPGSCGTLGQARLYTIDFQNGAAFNDTNGNGNIEASDRYYGGSGGNTLTGLPSSPVAAIVPLKVVNGETVIMSGGGQTTAKPDGQQQVVCSGTHCNKAPGAFGERIRTWWQQLFD